MEIGAKIKEARTRTGLTQEQAAEALGVSRKTVSNWENEKTYPGIVSVVKMSDLYAVSLDRLLKDGEGGSEYLDYLGDSTDTVPQPQTALGSGAAHRLPLCLGTGSDRVLVLHHRIGCHGVQPHLSLAAAACHHRAGIASAGTAGARPLPDAVGCARRRCDVYAGGILYLQGSQYGGIRGTAPARVGHAPGGGAALKGLGSGSPPC